MALESIGNPWLWTGFILFVVVMLSLDLGVFHRRAHVVSFREALTWTGVWVTLSMLFGTWVWFNLGAKAGLEFFTGYLIEESLSIDNLFVFVIVFNACKIPAVHQHRVLFWGILTALILRAVMILAGAAMLVRFHWLIYIFGGFLVITGIRLFVNRNKEPNPEAGRGVRLVRRLIPSTQTFHGDRFFVIENGKRVATPLFMALIIIELTDVVFALDSIPAIFAVTLDPFIVFTSNIFAIMGLRSLFFVLARMIDKFDYLNVGLSIVLVFVGLKMLVADWYKIPAAVSLLTVASVIFLSIIASIIKNKRVERASV